MQLTYLGNDPRMQKVCRSYTEKREAMGNG